MLYSKYHKDYYKKDVEDSPVDEIQVEEEVAVKVEDETPEPAPKPKPKRRRRAASKKPSKQTES